jgi:hypothetical protein
MGVLDGRLTTLLCKKITVGRSKEVNTGWFNSRQPGKLNKALGERNWKNISRNSQIWQNLLRKAMVQQGFFFQ